MAAAECMVHGLIAAMDRLWFHQNIIIPFSEMSDDEDATKPPPPQTLQISPLDEKSSRETDDLEKNEATTDDDERPKGRYYSSSLISTEKRRSRNHPTLKKTSSCKSLMDLELEEVKGFMDLGFIFRRENLTKRIIHLVPGLQRINGSSEDDEDERQRKEIIRPYLSEAWVIRKFDSPLLNLRIPTVSTAADMKKHLKYWAHTVASAIHQES